MFLIRADGNAKIGAGHLMRCLTIAAELAVQGGTGGLLFLCADELSAELVREHGFRAVTLGTDYQDMESELPAWEEKQKLWENREKYPVILVDSYYVTEHYLEGLKSFGKVVLLDDIGQKRFPVDGVVNYNAFAERSVYERLYAGTNTKLWIGSSYVPLRQQFGDRNYVVREQAKTVLITTGGGDSENIAGKILETVFCVEAEYHLVAGQFNPHLAELQQWEKEHSNVHIHCNVADMADLMLEADVAITAGGSTVYELAALGVPFICFSYAENQEQLTEYISENHIAGYAGAYHKSPSAVLGSIQRELTVLLGDVKMRRQYHSAEKQLVDGKGAERLAKELLLGKKVKFKPVHGIAALVLFAALFLAAFCRFDSGDNRQTVQLVTFGDSVFGLERGETAIPNQIASLTGVSYYNGAMGGTCVGKSLRNLSLAQTKDTLSLVSLMESIGADDFGVQQTVRIRENNTEYFEENIDNLAEIDFSQVELVLIQHGLNDFYSGIPLENEENPFDEYTFAGALRKSLRILREKYPDLRIVLATPTYTWYFYTHVTCEEYDLGYGNLAAYVQAEMEIAEEYGVEVIDLYHNLFPHEEWEDWERYTFDGLHPNEAGRKLIAERIAEYLNR